MTGLRPEEAVLARSLAACIVALCLLVACPQESQREARKPAEPGAAKKAAAPGTARPSSLRIPVPSFLEENVGQSDPAVRFLSTRRGYALFLTDDALVATVVHAESLREQERALRTQEKPDPKPAPNAAVFKMQFLGARADASPRGEDALRGTASRVAGRDATKHFSGIPLYGAARYAGLYPGVDLLVRTEGGAVSYEIEAGPEAAVDDVRFAFPTATKVSLDAGGNALIYLGDAPVLLTAPRAFELHEGRRSPLQTAYMLEDGQLGFSIAGRTQGRPLIIDPAIVFGTYYGGSLTEDPWAREHHGGPKVSVAEPGKPFIGINASSPDYPGENPPVYETGPPYLLHTNACVLALDLATPQDPPYSKCFGGTDGGSTQLSALAAVPGGSVYVLGHTNASDFPPVSGAFSNTLAMWGEADFLLRLDENGDIDRSSFVPPRYGGRGDLAVEVAGTTPGVYTAGGVYFMRQSTVDLMTFGEFLGLGDAVITKFDLDLQNLQYLSILPGSGADEAYAIAAKDGHAYVTGSTRSTDFITSPDAFDTQLGPNAASGQTECEQQPDSAGCEDIFVAKLDTAGAISNVVDDPDSFSTFLGGRSVEAGLGIAVDDLTRIHVAGYADAALPNEEEQIYLARFSESGEFIDGRYFGGKDDDWARDVATDAENRSLLTGSIHHHLPYDSNFVPDPSLTPPPPVSGALLPNPLGQRDVYFAIFGETGVPEYFTYLGGPYGDYGTAIATDAAGCVYITGLPEDLDPSLLVNAIQEERAGFRDTFVVVLCPVQTVVRLDKRRMSEAMASQLGWDCVQGAAREGEEVCFEVVLTLESGDPADDLVLTDFLPAQLAYQAHSTTGSASCTAQGVTLHCAGVAVAENQPTLLWIRTAVAPGAAPGERACNTAEVTALGAEIVPANPAEECVLITDVPPDLEIEKESVPAQVEVGEQFVYTITVVNVGSEDSAAGTLVDTLPTGITVLSLPPGANSDGSEVTIPLPSLAPGEEFTATLTVYAEGGGTYFNESEVVVDGSVVAIDGASTEVEGPVAVPELFLRFDGPDTVGTDEEHYYTLRIRNVGPGPAEDVRVIATSPSLKNIRFTAVSLQEAVIEQGGDRVTWNLAEALESGGDETLGITAVSGGQAREVELAAQATTSTLAAAGDDDDHTTTIAGIPADLALEALEPEVQAGVRLWRFRVTETTGAAGPFGPIAVDVEMRGDLSGGASQEVEVVAPGPVPGTNPVLADAATNTWVAPVNLYGDLGLPQTVILRAPQSISLTDVKARLIAPAVDDSNPNNDHAPP